MDASINIASTCREFILRRDVGAPGGRRVVAEGGVTVEGILVSRIAKARSIYLWSIIPRMHNLDVLETSAPENDDLYFVVASGGRLRRYLRRLVIAEATRRDVLSPGGALPMGDIRRVEAHELTVNALKRIDQKASVHDVSYESVDTNLLIDISSMLGGGVRFVKRFYSLQVIVPIIADGNEERILVPLQEMFLFLQESPGSLRQIVVLPSYYFALLIVEPVSLDILTNVIMKNTLRSSLTYISYVDRLSVVSMSGTED